MQELNDPLTKAEREQMDETFNRFHKQLATTPNTERQTKFSSVEMAEIAKADAVNAGLKTVLRVFSHGHTAVSVGYPADCNVAQHPVNLRLQRKHEMVSVDTTTVENKSAPDYTVVTYFHRADYDDAVETGVMEGYL